MWESKRSRFKKPDQYYYSIANKLKTEKKIDERFEILLSSLTLEEIIGLRLELAARTVNHKLYGINLWHSVQDVVRDGVLKYAYSASRTKGEAASFLGVDISVFKKLLKKYNVTNYFDRRSVGVK
tara:strand:- start:154 stop:528 length:375 start_codon:yes stop_codon:yes gene_type:complete